DATVTGVQTCALPIYGARKLHVLEETRRNPREGVAACRARGDPDRGDQDTLEEDAGQEVPGRGSDGEPHAELARARADRKREHRSEERRVGNTESTGG